MSLGVGFDVSKGHARPDFLSLPLYQDVTLKHCCIASILFPCHDDNVLNSETLSKVPIKYLAGIVFGLAWP